MKHLRVHLKIDYADRMVPVEVCYTEKSGFTVTFNNRHFKVYVKGRRWLTSDKGLLLHMDTVAANYHETVKLFKWNLPDPLKEAIYSVEIKMFIPSVTIQLDYEVDSKKFIELLRHHLIMRRIRLRAPIFIHDIRTNITTNFDLGLKPKQTIPALAPLTQKDFDKIVIKPE